MESVRKHSKMLDWQVKQIKEPFKDFAISVRLYSPVNNLEIM